MTTGEPRAHHYVPQCWLAGFTDNGEKTGTLWVTDLERKKQWQTTPPNAGHERDFYRVSEVGLDPVLFEKQFSKIESDIAPLLKELYTKPRWPTPEELAELEVFIALQYIRVPAFRPIVLRMAERIHRLLMRKALKSPATWEKTLNEASIPLDSEGADYNKMRAFEQSGEYSLVVGNAWFLVQGFKAAVDAIIPSLEKRYWGALLSTTGSFVASDNPVMLDGPKGKIGFESAGVILFSLNKHILLCGTQSSQPPPRITYNLIARHNTFAIMNAQYIYSAAPNFCWLDENDKVQHDWQLFDRAKFPSPFAV